MITLNQLSMVYGNKLLFTDATVILNDKTRYALVGANGAGKSTLLRLMTGEELPADGTISMPKKVTIGWLKQDQFRYEENNVVDVVLMGKPQLWEALVEKEEILNSEELGEKEGYRLAILEEIIMHQDGYSANAFAEKLLTGLGIDAKYHYQPLKLLSGGYKLRALLAQTLFQQPNILLLDEPTNHLDIVSIDWLENYLRTEFEGLLVFISHDMEFIDRLANYILDVDYGEVRQYSGNYAKFLAEKKLIEEQKLSEKKHVEDKIKVMQGFVDRFGASAAKARQAQSRVKMIEKLETPDIKKSSRIAPSIHFKMQRSSGKRVLLVKELGKSFGERKLFNKLNIEINRGEKLAILGVNGAGKSTLIKTLLNLVTPDEGSYEWGHEAHLSYVTQDHHDELNQSMTILEWLSEQTRNKPDLLLRKTLGHMLFTQDGALKDVQTLSGGEAARMLLAKMILQEGNILLLDEPTNHLDLEATEALADALATFAGTVIFVSHNRHFVERVANRILFITENKVIDFRGGYKEFSEKYLLHTR